MENEKEIKVGDYVRINDGGEVGYVASIVDYGTHIAYFVELGTLLKFPAKREWITKLNGNIYDGI